MKRRRSHQRAAALILVLMTLLVILAWTTVATSRGMHIGLASVIDRDSRRADELLPRVDDLVTDWLAREADSIVLRQTLTPATLIEDVAWSVGGHQYAVRLQAWDQCGMTPRQMTGSLGSTLDSATGLDDIADTTAAVFPRDVLDVDAIGSWMRIQDTMPSAINVNTAPATLIRAALRDASLADTDRILRDRRAGRRTVINHLIETSTPDRIVLTDRSSVWSVRIDIRINAVVRSWWSVYRKRGRWTCVQRLLIHE